MKRGIVLLNGLAREKDLLENVVNAKEMEEHVLFVMLQDGESEVIDLEDEEEIDDVEKEVIDLETPKKSKDGEKRELEDGDEPEKKKVKASEEEKEEEKDDE